MIPILIAITLIVFLLQQSKHRKKQSLHQKTGKNTPLDNNELWHNQNNLSNDLLSDNSIDSKFTSNDSYPSDSSDIHTHQNMNDHTHVGISIDSKFTSNDSWSSDTTVNTDSVSSDTPDTAITQND